MWHRRELITKQMSPIEKILSRSIMKRQSSISAACLLALWAAPLFPNTLTASDYSTAVLADGPAAYYRLGDETNRVIVNQNSGSIGALGNATQNLGRVHTIPGAITGDPGRAAFFDFTSRTEIPWTAGLNPANTEPFTIEAWFYPASDQTATGQCPMNNRYAYSGADRQGWVFFQRKPNAEYNGSEPVGWNFRMFRGSGGSTGLDVVSGVPYKIGQWTHVVVVYDPANVVDASVTMYIDGQQAAKSTWTGGADGTTPGYAANTNDHDPAQAVRGAAALAIGNYNNTAGTSLNPYFGGVDEFALYRAKLTPEQILSHYQNATNASRTVSYSTLIQSHNPAAYLHLDEASPGPDIAVNLGETRAIGHGTHTADVRHPAPGALVGAVDGSVAYHNRNGNSTTTLPWNALNNGGADKPFSTEFWVRPLRDQQGGQCPVNNRWVGGTGRTGWVLFQRNPNLSYPASEGHGWNFRFFTGAGNSGSDVNTDTDYRIGEWQHLVFTWEPLADNGDPNGNGNSQWTGNLTAYVNGVAVNTNTAALYAANREVPEDNGVPADLAIGAYNAKSGLGNNPFEGNIDEFALYNNYLLTPEQVAAHYQAGTNAHPAVSYENLVLTAPFTGPERQGPATYFRFNDAARAPLANAGSIGSAADGHAVLTDTSAAGPRPPAFAGFEAGNRALGLAGPKTWASLNNPDGLAISNRITLSAWVRLGQDVAASAPARILARGPLTQSSFLTQILDGGLEINALNTNTTEVSLRIEQNEGVLRYAVGTIESLAGQGLTVQSASAAVPAGDISGGNWIQLTGTYDGTTWRLYRNGAEIASAAAPGTALATTSGDWAIGSTGNGWEGLFNGAVDEVAIYDKALSAARIQAQYTTGVSGAVVTPLTVGIARNGSNATLTWSSGTLQQSDAFNGTYTDVPNATSPLTVTPSGSGKFYKLR